MTIEIFEVGGCVRDEILGTPSKDVDFSVIAPSFEAMSDFLVEHGIKIVVSKPEFGTIRGVAPKSGFRGFKGGLDFVWARKEGPYSDGRRPDWTKPGTLLDDLSRRDFSMNAMAKDEAGKIIDPFGGQNDLRDGMIRTVGDPDDRIREDSLRIMRALRFSITKRMFLDARLVDSMLRNAHLLENVSVERVREELEKMFAFDTFTSMTALQHQFFEIGEIVFVDMGIRLKPSLEK